MPELFFYSRKRRAPQQSPLDHAWHNNFLLPPPYGFLHCIEMVSSNTTRSTSASSKDTNNTFHNGKIFCLKSSCVNSDHKSVVLVQSDMPQILKHPFVFFFFFFFVRIHQFGSNTVMTQKDGFRLCIRECVWPLRVPQSGLEFIGTNCAPMTHPKHVWVRPWGQPPFWLKPLLSRSLECCKICFLCHPVRTYCDVGLRSRFPQCGRRSPWPPSTSSKVGLHQIVAAKILASRQPLATGSFTAGRLTVSKQPTRGRTVLEEPLEGQSRRQDGDAAPLKVALEQARGQARFRPVGERLDLQLVERMKKQIATAQDRERQVQSDREKYAEGLRNLEVLRAGANAQPQPQIVERTLHFIPI